MYKKAVEYQAYAKENTMVPAEVLLLRAIDGLTLQELQDKLELDEKDAAWILKWAAGR